MAIWSVFFSLVLLLRESTCFTLVVEPPYQIVPPGKTTIKILCQADVPLAGCQVINLNHNKIYDLNNGSLSANYWGTGLANGQCGISLEATLSAFNYLAFGCRARELHGEWEYATSVVQCLDNPNGVLPTRTIPRKIIADPGTSVSMKLAASNPLNICFFNWSNSTWLSNGTSKDYSIDNSKLTRGSCSLTVYKVRPDTSRVVLGETRSKEINGSMLFHMHSTTLIVKTTPGPPALFLNKVDGVYQESDVMEATCSVGPARPVTRIFVLLNNVIINSEEPKDFATFPWEYEAASNSRKFSRKLLLEDHGKVLVCKVYHIGFPGGFVEISKNISVQEGNSWESDLYDVRSSRNGK